MERKIKSRKLKKKQMKMDDGNMENILTESDGKSNYIYSPIFWGVAEIFLTTSLM